ncbi:MAG TPA: hypothetical protein VH643_13590 [Gemmataceae bacterium]
MPTPSLFSSIARFGMSRFVLSALASLQSIVVWVVLMVCGLVLVEEAKLLKFHNLGAVGFVESCLVLALVLGILSMPFVYRFVWKATAPVVNERIPLSKKLIVSVLSSMSVGQILWWLGMAVIVPIFETIEEYAPSLRNNKDQVGALIAAAPSLVAMSWFGYKVYRRLSAAELIVAEDGGRKFGDAFRPPTNNSSVTGNDGSAIKPQC